MREQAVVRAGGAALIVGAVAFLGVFAFLAARFDYPSILDGRAGEVLPRLRAIGPTGRAVWALYGFLPLVWIPAGVGAFYALRGPHEGSMRIGMMLALVAAIAMMLGLLRWPSIHWVLAEAYAQGEPAERSAIAALFTGLNSYLGNYIGEFLGELSISVFFLLSALAIPGAGFGVATLDGLCRGRHGNCRACRHVPKYHQCGGTDCRPEQLSAADLDGGLRQRAVAGQSLALRSRARLRAPALIARG
jgi:hypothetical protein